MRGLGKILLSFSLVTSVLLFYVGERVEILRVSYRMDTETGRLTEQSEELRQLRFEVAQLRSPYLLEKRLEELPLPLTLPKQIQALKVPSVESLPLSGAPPLASPGPNLIDFLGQCIQIAHARTND